MSPFNKDPYRAAVGGRSASGWNFACSPPIFYMAPFYTVHQCTMQVFFQIFKYFLKIDPNFISPGETAPGAQDALTGELGFATI